MYMYMQLKVCCELLLAYLDIAVVLIATGFNKNYRKVSDLQKHGYTNNEEKSVCLTYTRHISQAVCDINLWLKKAL